MLTRCGNVLIVGSAVASRSRQLLLLLVWASYARRYGETYHILLSWIRSDGAAIRTSDV